MDAMPKTSICPDCAGAGSDTHMRSMNPPYQKLVARQCTVVTARDEFLFRPCPLRPLQPPIPTPLEPRLRHFAGGLVTVGVDVRWSRQHNAVERPEEPDGIRNAAAFVDATYIPVATEHAVIDAVLIDAVAKAGRAELEGHTALDFCASSQRS